MEENVTEEKIVTEEVAANEEDTSVVEEDNIAEEVVNGTAEASLTEEVNHPKESLSQVNEEPNKRRTRRVWPILVVLLPVIALVGLYFYAPQGEVFAPDNRIATDVSDKVDVETDIVVNPHLEKEFVDELGRIPEPDLLLDSLVNDSSSANIKEVSGSVVGSSASVAEVGDTLVIIESLLVKDLKSITISDTLDYVIEGTLAVHKLKSGETIIRLANKYYGEKRLWPYIVKHNGMANFNSLAIGQEILIPQLRNK